jgi:putative methionine-R-sulfoxide reductase with GAF domain
MTQAHSSLSDARSAGIVTRTLAVFATLSLLGVFLYSYVAWLGGEWQLYLLLVALTSFAGVCFYCLREARSGRRERAIIILLVAVLFLAVAASLLLAGVGMLTGLIVIVMVLQIGSRTLANQAAFYLLLASFAVAVIVALLDVLNVPFQHVEPLARPFTIIAAGFVIVTYGYVLVRDFSYLPWRTKLILSFLTIAALSIVSVAFISTYYARATLTQNANESLLAQAAETREQIDRFLQNTRASVQAEAQAGELVQLIELPLHARTGSFEGAQVKAILTAVSRRDATNILSYALLDAAGNNLADTREDQIGTNEAGQPYFQQIMAGDATYISDIQVAGAGSSAYLYFSAPVHNEAGDIIGVLRVQYDANVIQQIVNASLDLAGAGSYAVLLDEYNIYLAHSRAPGQKFRTVSSLTLETIRDLQAGGRLPLLPPEYLSLQLPALVEQLSQADGETVFTASDVATDDLSQAAVTALDNKPWQVVFFQPQTAFLEPVNQQVNAIGLAAIMIFALVTLGAVVVAQRLANPVLRLTQTAQEVASGNLSAEADVVANDEIGVLAAAFNNMVAQLRELIGSLEQRVAERTRALQTSAEVSRRLSTILDREQLISEVVHEVQTAFDYYHVHIYLYDQEKRRLQMAGGTGQAAKMMLARKHAIQPGQGLVGQAAAANQAVLVPDVALNENWLPNPLLPDTRSEIAVPIAVGSNVLGVLDVQHNVSQGLSEEDQSLLQSVANQIAVALNNAQLYEQTQRVAEHEALVNRINQQIQRATTVEDVLQVASQELGQALGATQAAVYLRNKQIGRNGRDQS